MSFDLLLNCVLLLHELVHTAVINLKGFDMVFKLNFSSFFTWCFHFHNPNEVKMMIDTFDLLLIGTYTDSILHICIGIFQLYFPKATPPIAYSGAWLQRYVQ